ncbi:hypothetical protein [Azospirillum palustre]|nr:hypothetical protein [Azospirillum palustre]
MRAAGADRGFGGGIVVPDHLTFWWFARRWLSAELVASALAETMSRVKPDGQRCQFALDSTGLWRSHTSRYFEWGRSVSAVIQAKKRRSIKVVATTPYRQEMHRLLNDPGDAASKRAYRQRWRVATVMSVAKRRWGEALSARTDLTQRSQALLRGVVYNVSRLVLLGIAT